MQPLAGKIALVTGGGTGIGKAIAGALAGAGVRTVITGRTHRTLEATAETIRRSGGSILALTCNVTLRSDIAALKGTIAERLGAVDILINNAGITPAAPFLEMEDSVWDETLAVNVTGVYNCCKAFLPEMVRRRWGRIINIGSTVCKVAYPNISAYVASKHALLGLTRALALDTARFGVTVNAICPGYVNTDLTRDNARRLAKARGVSEAQALETLAHSSPQGRLIDPDEIAALAVMLAGEAGRGISGQGINIDGGAAAA